MIITKDSMYCKHKHFQSPIHKLLIEITTVLCIQNLPQGEIMASVNKAWLIAPIPDLVVVSLIWTQWYWKTDYYPGRTVKYLGNLVTKPGYLTVYSDL